MFLSPIYSFKGEIQKQRLDFYLLSAVIINLITSDWYVPHMTRRPRMF